MIVVLPDGAVADDPEDDRARLHAACVPELEHPAGPDVLRLDPHQLLERRRVAVPGRLVDPVGVPQPSALERVADAARVGESGLAHPPFEVLAQRLRRPPADTRRTRPSSISSAIPSSSSSV